MASMKFRSLNYRVPQLFVLIFFGVFLSGYFSYHILYGAKSFARLNEVQKEIQVMSKNLDKITKESNEIEEKVTMLRYDTISEDFLEERVRKILGYQAEKELILSE
ncbi:MAG: septum formation initiator family protein [Alphaproteobacteria bacterium]|nr:septum formation initiator family protein [Alphaproteobacteria bacterium]